MTYIEEHYLQACVLFFYCFVQVRHVMNALKSVTQIPVGTGAPAISMDSTSHVAVCLDMLGNSAWYVCLNFVICYMRQPRFQSYDFYTCTGCKQLCLHTSHGKKKRPSFTRDGNVLIPFLWKCYVIRQLCCHGNCSCTDLYQEIALTLTDSILASENSID